MIGRVPWIVVGDLTAKRATSPGSTMTEMRAQDSASITRHLRALFGPDPERASTHVSAYEHERAVLPASTVLPVRASSTVSARPKGASRSTGEHR